MDNGTKEYLKVIAVSIPFMLFSLVTYNQFRLCGNVKDGMKGLLSGMLTNIILDPILMFGFKLGFIGAAYATLIGQIIGAAVLFALTGKNGNIVLNLKNVRFTRENIYECIRNATLCICNFSYNGFVKKY
ncbi:MAG: MATE family efflux transporter [Catonella sp.]|uniref:MATE family efflux transporter n=1 Tax=Catonella sp. TaxID=2382125 RepID=UPI003FA1779B